MDVISSQQLKRRLAVNIEEEGCNDEPMTKKIKLTPPVHINDMPDDILYELFKYFAPVDLNGILANVSLRWKSITLHPMFWKYVVLYKTQVEFDTTAACNLLVTASSHLLELSIMDRTDCDAILKQVAKSNRNLMKLTMCRCHGSSNNVYINASVIKNVLLKLTKIQTFRFADTQFRSVKFFEIFGSRQFIDHRTKGKSKPNSITYTGVLTFKQLEAYTRSANSAGRIRLNNGKEYTIKRLRRILEHAAYNPNSVVQTLDHIL